MAGNWEVRVTRPGCVTLERIGAQRPRPPLCIHSQEREIPKIRRPTPAHPKTHNRLMEAHTGPTLAQRVELLEQLVQQLQERLVQDQAQAQEREQAQGQPDQAQERDQAQGPPVACSQQGPGADPGALEVCAWLDQTLEGDVSELLFFAHLQEPLEPRDVAVRTAADVAGALPAAASLHMWRSRPGSDLWLFWVRTAAPVPGRQAARALYRALRLITMVHAPRPADFARQRALAAQMGVRSFVRAERDATASAVWHTEVWAATEVPQ